ncbi:MAG: HAMP domain-containing sensor histidine kinase [Arcicella sp.]|nr:HAMP domain-containing sensor histidine kinase [Arcicella sp.]
MLKITSKRIFPKKTFKITAFTISLLLIVKPALFAQTPSKVLSGGFIEMLIESNLTKFIYTVSFGFFVGLSTVCAISYLFFRRYNIILWFFNLSLSLAVAYIGGLMPYYFHNIFMGPFFFGINNIVHLNVIFCGYRIIQDITGYKSPPYFSKLSAWATFALICSILSHFIEKGDYIVPFQFAFLLACLVLMHGCYLMLNRAANENILDKIFVKNIIVLSLISCIKAFPIIEEYTEILFDLRLLNDILLPLAISTFLALIFVKNMKNHTLKQEEVRTLILEKQAILETQNEYLAKQVAQQTSELKALNSTKDRLFSIIGHDLRSPIASLKGILLLLDNQQLSREEFNELLQHLQKNVDNVHGMLENLLQWSMSQMKGMKPNLKSFDINDIIEQTVELFKDVAKQKQINLQMDISENLMVFADENHIKAIIRNLVNNALKFTPKNGQVSISSKFKNNYVVLQITDSGIGINSDEMQLIFTNPKLKQGTSGEKGTGLGLILCKDLIKQNYGEITVKSELEKGTTFKILIPQKAEY